MSAERARQLLLGRRPSRRTSRARRRRRCGRCRRSGGRASAPTSVCSARHHWPARAKSPTLVHAETVWHSAQPGATRNSKCSATASARALVQPRSPSVDVAAGDERAAEDRQRRPPRCRGRRSLPAQLERLADHRDRRVGIAARDELEVGREEEVVALLAARRPVGDEVLRAAQPGARDGVVAAEVEVVRAPATSPCGRRRTHRPPPGRRGRPSRARRTWRPGRPATRPPSSRPPTPRAVGLRRLLVAGPAPRPRRPVERRATGGERVVAGHGATLPVRESLLGNRSKCAQADM